MAVASDADVIAALVSYGVRHSRSKTPLGRATERLFLLAGFMCSHAQIGNYSLAGW
jgi:hypothetical protein